MRQYEVMVILDAGLEEDAIRTIVDRATQVIANRWRHHRQGRALG